VIDDIDLLVLEPVAAPATPSGRGRRRLRQGMAAVAVAVAAVATVGTVAGGDHSDHTATDDEVPRTPRDRTVAVAPAPGGGGESAAPAAPSRPPPGPVVEELPLRGDGGLGPYAAGASRAEVVALASSLLGAPGAEPAPAPTPCADDPSLTVTQETEWDDLVLTFAGTGEDDLRLVGWEALARRGAPRRFRIAGGPAIGDPLTAWRQAYGADLEVHDRLAGDGGQTRVTIHLPDGDVALFGGARASAFAYLARGGSVCT
jgi:hypothetical protein